MMEIEKFSIQDVEIITLINQTQKTEVYLASNKNLPCSRERFVILKKHRREMGTEHYRRIAELHSPYFPKLYGVWKEDGNTYLLEEYISGRTLQDKLDAGEILQESEITYYMTALCEALRVLHSMEPPVIHRDLKPENVMISADGKVKLLDFDAAREYKEQQEHDTIAMGTREYAPPEQFGFAQTDVRSDIYSWGIIFAELLEYAAVSKSYAGKVRKIIDKATMFDPKRRYNDTEMVLRDLRKLERGKGYSFSFRILVTGFIVILVGIGVQEKVIIGAAFRGWEVHQLQGIVKSSDLAQVTDSIQPPEPENEKIVEAEGQTAASTDTREYSSLNEVYEYTSFGEGMLERNFYFIEEYPHLYNTPGFEGEDDNMYNESLEAVLGKNQTVLCFLKSAPRDVVFCDDRMRHLKVESVLYSMYREDLGVYGDWTYVDAADYSQEFENVLSISSEVFQAWETGLYMLRINVGTGKNSIQLNYYVVVHGEEEKVDNFGVRIFSDIGYYSSEKKNDMVFYTSNTPFPIKEIRVGNYVLQENEYDLVDDGFGAVLHSEFMERYKELQSIDLVITLENDKLAGYRIINLDVFDWE